MTICGYFAALLFCQKIKGLMFCKNYIKEKSCSNEWLIQPKLFKMLEFYYKIDRLFSNSKNLW